MIDVCQHFKFMLCLFYNFRMKSMQVLFVCAFVVLCTANPIPDEETVTSTSAPVAEVAQPQSAELPVPEVKSIEVPAINKPITETPSVKSEERIPEPQALPSKSEESSTATADDKKREIQEPVVQQAKSVQPTEVATEVKSEQPAQNVEGVVPPKALETVSQASEQPAHVHVEQKPAESVKSLAPESTQQPAQESVTVPATETKQAAVPAIESTVIPAGISSERKIDAGKCSISKLINHFESIR